MKTTLEQVIDAHEVVASALNSARAAGALPSLVLRLRAAYSLIRSVTPQSLVPDSSPSTLAEDIARVLADDVPVRAGVYELLDRWRPMMGGGSGLGIRPVYDRPPGLPPHQERPDGAVILLWGGRPVGHAFVTLTGDFPLVGERDRICSLSISGVVGIPAVPDLSRKGSGGTIIPSRPGDPPRPETPMAPKLPARRPPDADDCERAPRVVCEHGLTATAERLLWPPPAVCEGDPRYQPIDPPAPSPTCGSDRGRCRSGRGHRNWRA